MRQFFFLLLLMSFVFHLTAQNRWSFGIDAQVGLTGKTEYLYDDESFSGGSRYSDIRENRFSPAAGAGAWVQFQITPGLGLRSGMGYLNSGNKDSRMSYSEVLATEQVTLNYATIYEFRVHQLQVPLELTLQAPTGKIKPLLSFGVQLNQEWRGNIHHKAAVDGDLTYVNNWSKANSDLDQSPRPFLQPIASIGLSLNDQMSIRLRQTWSIQREISWNQGFHVPEVIDPSTGIIICGVFNSYNTETTHQRLTSLQLVYRLF